MSADNWYIARDKEKLGPFPTQQMKTMAGTGQLLPSDMVLQDGSTQWKPASQVEEFFPTSVSASRLPPLPPPVPPELTEWHFTQNGQQAGPVTWTQLRQRAASGQLHPSDMVWKAGMAGWAAASSVPAIFPQVPPGLPSQTIPPVASISTEDAETHFARGDKCQDDGHFSRAVLHFTKALECDPTYAEALNARSNCYDEIGEPAKAIDDLAEAIRLCPNNPMYLANRATAYSNNRDYEKAIADITEAIRIAPTTQRYTDKLALYYNCLGVRHQQANDINKAIAWANEAIRLRPNEAQYLSNRANFYVVMDDYSAALADFERAAQLDPNDPDTQGQIEQLRRALGIKATALGVGGPSAADSPSQVPTASWPPGLYYHMNGSWHLVKRDDGFESEMERLVKNKSITNDTFVVGVPSDDMTPKQLGSFPDMREVIDRIANPPSGLWKAVKVAGLFTAFAAGSIFKAVARYDAAPSGKALCLKCRNPVDPTATRCPFCQGDPREI